MLTTTGKLRAVAAEFGLTTKPYADNQEGQSNGFVGYDAGLIVFCLDSGEFEIRSAVHPKTLLTQGQGAPALRRQLEVAGRPLLPLAPDLTIEGAPLLRVVA